MRLVTDIRADWPRIRASLEVVQAKSPEDWIAEDVYHALQSQQAAAYLSEDGVLIVQRLLTEFTRQPYLHVWIAHGDMTDAALDFLRSVAKSAGCTRITFGSTRLGWAKRFPLVSATFEVPLA
jgi:hypothetical protein